MTNNEYHMLGMTHHMLREFHKQRNQKQALLTPELAPLPVYPAFDDEVFSYPIYTNPGCQNLTANELLADNMTEEQCRRWRFFFNPEADKLPHESQWQILNQQLAELKYRYRISSTPRFISLAACVMMIILLVARGHFLLSIIPIGALMTYWFRSENRLRKARHALIRHLQEMEHLYNQRDNIQHQLDSLPPPADIASMQADYIQAITRLLQRSLTRVLPQTDALEPATALHKHQWQGFLVESWAYQQLPLHAAASLTQTLLDAKDAAMLAVQTDSRGKNTLFRLQYLHIWVLAERGLLSAEAYYDRVTDTFIYEQHELLPYSNIRRISLVEQILPEYPALKTVLPDSLHRRYLCQPIGVLSLEMMSGVTHTCALPPASFTQYGKDWTDNIGLKTDMAELNRLLHKHILLLAAHAA